MIKEGKDQKRGTIRKGHCGKDESIRDSCKMMIRLTKNRVLMMQEKLIRASGGSPGIPAKTSRLDFGIVKNHLMIDGNKRPGTIAIEREAPTSKA